MQNKNEESVDVPISVLDKLIEQLTRQNKNSKALRDVIQNLSDKIDGEPSDSSNDDEPQSQLQSRKKDSAGTKSVDSLTKTLTKFEKTLNKMAQDAAKRYREGVKGKKKKGNSNPADPFNLNDDDDHPDEYVKVKKQKGISGALRRGILDSGNDIKSKGFKDDAGRAAGKLLSFFGGITPKEQQKLAAKHLNPDLVLDRATSNDPTKREELLHHEKEMVKKYKYKVDSGEIELADGVKPAQAVKEFQEKLVKKNNLEAIEKRKKDFAPDYQAELRYDLDMPVTAKEKARQEKKEIERASSSNRLVQQSLLPHEQRIVNTLKKDVETGKVSLLNKDASPEVAVQEMAKQMIDSANIKALQKTAPDKVAKYQYDYVPGGIPQKDSVKEKPAPSVILDPITIGNEPELQFSNPKNEAIPSDINALFDRIKNDSDYAFAQKDAGTQLPPLVTTPAKIEPKQKAEAISPVKANKVSVKTPAIASSMTAAIAAPMATPAASHSFDMSSLKSLSLSDLKVESMTIGSLSIQSLLKPESQEKESTEPAAESAGGGMGLPDINLSRNGGGIASKLGGVGSFLGKAGRLAGKAAVPLAAGMALYDGVTGYSNAAENLDINGREATFGEKMSSAAGSVASGLTFGMVDKKSAGKGIASFFGAGPGASDLTPITGDQMMAIPDQKQADLAAAKDENDQLKQNEKDLAQTGNNTIINAPTNVTAGGGKSIPPASNVRASHNAYERFVDRVFTAM